MKTTPPPISYLIKLTKKRTSVKQNVSISQKFEFSHVYPWDVMAFVDKLDTTKSTSGDIPSIIIKVAKERICVI